MTLKVASLYHRIISSKINDVFLLSLENRSVWERGPEMIDLEEKYLIPAEKFVFIMPEYNASFPGILKVMIDNSNVKKCWWYKKAILVGVSDGRAGNLRGIEHMTSILHYMKVHVMYNKVLLSKINDEMDAGGNLKNIATATLIEQQINEFINF